MAPSNARDTPVLANLKCILICVAMSMANMQYGFDTATISGFQGMIGFLRVFGYENPAAKIGWSIAQRPQQLIASNLNLGTIVGLFFTTIFARYFGRRQALWMGSLLSAVGSGVQIGTTSLAGLCVGRVIIGISNAFYITFANVYIVEVTPPHLRAVLGSIFGIWVNVGSILGAVANEESNKAFSNSLAYQIPLACLYFVPLALTIVTFFVPESPRWLLMHDRMEEAEEALRRLRGDSLSEELRMEEFVEMVRGIEEEKKHASHLSFLDIFKGTDLRRTIICIGVVLSHSSSGLWLFLAYATYFFQMAGITHAFQASILTYCGMGAGAIVGMYFMFKVLGRRSMMLIGTASGGLCMLAVAISYTVAPGSQAAGKAIVAFCILFGFFYNGFSGTISWPLSGEVVSSRLRIGTFSFATGINYFFAWLISYCTPFFLNPAGELNWGPKYCYIWAGSNLVTFIFFYFMLPDMKGRSLEEIDELFEKRVSIRNFRKYECQIAKRAHEIAVHEMEKEHPHVEHKEV